ncbi:hypothetical protein BKG93_06745 [Rodentibacter ratti]|uniref:Channel forming colicins domain-containing protein n=1 Tax=Rodentibacter ratti TaxID=1906745 RepID=A0A1V3L489_9PAST|nr:colicin-like pore-forming protein [Rodentibacter ratti]OOF84655.1 hypothetical protein BKG93_06745 [Rodentibacter ratti]
MSNDTIMLDPIIVTPNDNPPPITIGGKPYYPGPSFGVFLDLPPHIVIKPLNLKLGQAGLVNLAEFTLKIRDVEGTINRYNAQLSRAEISQAILEARKWLDEYALDFENSREIEVYIEALESALKILENAEKNTINLQKEADRKFDELLNNNIVRLSNFKKFKDSKPGLISAAYESNIAYFRSPKMTKEYIRLWKDKVEEPQAKILLEKQKMEASLHSLIEVKQSLGSSLEILKKKDKGNEIQTNVEYISSFFEHLTEKYGNLASIEARKLAETVKGKKIRSVEEAVKAFDKYKGSINKKFNTKDREAISKALQSLDMKSISNDLYKFNKAFKYGGKGLTVGSLGIAFSTAINTGDWKPFFLELEKLAVDKIATSIAAITLTFLVGTSIGIIGYSVLMVAVSALISDELIEKMHNSLFK